MCGGENRSKMGEDVGIGHIFSSPLISTMTSVEKRVFLFKVKDSLQGSDILCFVRSNK